MFADNERISWIQMERQFALAYLGEPVVLWTGTGLSGRTGLCSILLSTIFLCVWVFFLLRQVHVYRYPEKYWGRGMSRIIAGNISDLSDSYSELDDCPDQRNHHGIFCSGDFRVGGGGNFDAGISGRQSECAGEGKICRDSLAGGLPAGGGDVFSGGISDRAGDVEGGRG